MHSDQREQTVTIARRATAFTVVCAECTAAGDEQAGAGPGWAGASFQGSLDLDLDHGLFLCRRGHTVRIVRARQAARSAATEAA
jgi:hypothetical protein